MKHISEYFLEALRPVLEQAERAEQNPQEPAEHEQPEQEVAE